jgi:hypothetical protein
MNAFRLGLRPFLVLPFLMPARARAADPTTSDCLNANERAIALRIEHKLRASRAELLMCAAASCPADIRTECARKVEEVNGSMPTIVFEVEDGSGNDVSAVKLTMDGELLAERLEGTAVSIDPGGHVFRFEKEGLPPVEKRLIIFEGAKDRRERIVIGGAEATAAGLPTDDASSPSPAAPSPAPDTRGNTQRLLGWTAVGAGGVGLGIGLVFALVKGSKVSERDDICPTGNDCTADDASRINRLTDEARTASTASTVSFIAGGVFVAGGLALVFTAPRSSSAVAVAPAVGARFQGVTVTGSIW